MPSEKDENLENSSSGGKQPTESSKKAAGTALGAAAEAYGLGDVYQNLKSNDATGGAVDKLENQAAKKIDNNPLLRNAAKKLDNSNSLDAANAAMAAKSGNTPGSKGSGSELVNPLSTNKDSYSNNNGVADNSVNDSLEQTDSSSVNLNNKSNDSKFSKNSKSRKDSSGNVEDLEFEVKANVSLTVKVIAISSIFVIPILLMVTINSVYNGVLDGFKDFMGYFQFVDGDVDGEVFDTGDPDEMAFYERFVNIEKEYEEEGINVDGAYVMAGFSIITRNSDEYQYTDFNAAMIREFFDAGISDGTFSRDTFDTNVFSLLRKYLDSSFNEKFIKSEIEKLDDRLDEYEDFINGDSESGGMACNLTGTTTDDVFANLTTAEFIELVGPMAQQASAIAKSNGDNLFASVIIAQAAHESGWGKKAIHNNLFGVKCHGYDRCVSTATTENYGGVNVSINDDFRIYDSIEASIVNRNEFLIENTRYDDAGVFDAITPQQQVSSLKAAGYATDPDYVALVNSIIDDYNLEEWDNNNTFCLSSDAQFTPRTTKPTSDDYAFAMLDSTYRGQCVWYVRGRGAEVALEYVENGIIDQSTADIIRNRLNTTYANGGDWYDWTVGSKYFETSSNIQDIEAGAIIAWKKIGGYGHVAFIEDVNLDQNTITITDGWTNTGNCPSHWGCVNFMSRTIDIDAYFGSFGPSYDGDYIFSGYVYPLKPIL